MAIRDTIKNEGLIRVEFLGVKSDNMFCSQSVFFCPTGQPAKVLLTVVAKLPDLHVAHGLCVQLAHRHMVGAKGNKTLVHT